MIITFEGRFCRVITFLYKKNSLLLFTYLTLNLISFFSHLYYQYIYIKPKLLKLPQISMSAQYFLKKHKTKKKKRNKRHTFTMSASRCSAFPFHNALPSLPCLPLLPAPLRSDPLQTNSKASYLKTQRFLNENPPYP